MTAAVSAGGGVSKLAVIGLVAGGAAGAGAAIVLQPAEGRSAGGDRQRHHPVGGQRRAGIDGSRFSVQATGFEASRSVTAGSSATARRRPSRADPRLRHGRHLHRRRDGARCPAVCAFRDYPCACIRGTGTWVDPDLFRRHHARTHAVGFDHRRIGHVGGQTCPVSGTVRRGAPDIVLTSPGCPQTIFGDLPPHLFRFVLASDGSSLSGQADHGIVQYVLRFDRR